MQPMNNINDPGGLDELLKQAFLDLDLSKAENSQLMDEVAAQVMGGGTQVAGNEAKKIKGKGTASISKAWIWILSGVAGLSVTTLTGFLLFGGMKQSNVVAETPVENATPASVQKADAPTEVAPAEEIIPATSNNAIPNAADGEKTTGRKRTAATTTNHTSVQTGTIFGINPPGGTAYTTEPLTTATVLNTSAADPNNKAGETATGIDSVESIKASEQVTALPQLSPEELENHKKDLKTLDETFAGMRLSDYSKIEVDEKKSPVKGNFFLKKTEVTIKEYKLFLTDLLANGKVKEYTIAKPNLDNIWKDPKDKNSRAFLEMYFRKAKYENNPVICVSTEAMELYCNWMKERLESYYKRSKEKVKFLVRLPEVAEWKYVASEGNKRHRYGTSNGRLKEAKLGVFHKAWNANFIETQQKFVAVGDSLVVVESDKKEKITTTSKVSKSGFIGPARAYPTVKYDLFNMSGNVSEIVIYEDEKGNRKYRSIGGNWNSTANYLRIDAPDEFKGNTKPSPYIGFRPVIEIER
jgi:formylglycine-generating enzyme required for sulfatase activity